MSYQNVFKRYEIKYLVTDRQRKEILAAMAPHMTADRYGKSTVCNVYFDTPDFLLIRRSLEKPIYKEKLRVRSYGPAGEGDSVFVELKKKYKSVVYKRRFDTTEVTAMNYLSGGQKIEPLTQITAEIDYFLSFYRNLCPAAFISYEREAYYAKEDKEFRLTLDRNILWRAYDLSLCEGVYGEPLLAQGASLMELKTAGAIPLWMTRILCELELSKTSFSKYGNAYKAMQNSKITGGRIYA